MASYVVPKIVKRRRPKLHDSNEVKLLSCQFKFWLKSIDKSSKITKVVIDGESLVMATSAGKIMIFNQHTFKPIGNPY